MNAARETPFESLSAAIAAIAQGVAGRAVAIDQGCRTASGFVWRPGLVVAAAETFGGEEASVRTSSRDWTAARLVGRDEATDVALFKADGSEAAAIQWAPVPPVGAMALCVGADGEGGQLAALGIVSRRGGPWLSLRGGEIDARVELDLRLPARAEGGVALDASGRPFGMVVYGPRFRALVIPGATIDRVAGELQARGGVGRGHLGIGLQPVATSDGAPAAMAMSVDKDGPAAAAGLAQGDVIIAFDGSPVERLSDILDALGPGSVGRKVRVDYLRGGERRETTITIGERP